MSKVDWNSVKKEVPEWFRDAKFGLFFHWAPIVCRLIRMNGIHGVCMKREIPVTDTMRKHSEACTISAIRIFIP